MDGGPPGWVLTEQSGARGSQAAPPRGLELKGGWHLGERRTEGSAVAAPIRTGATASRDIQVV